MRLFPALGLSLCLAGCLQEPPIAGYGTGAMGSTSIEGADATSTTMAIGPDPTTQDGADGQLDNGNFFCALPPDDTDALLHSICDGGGGVVFECDVFDQDCAEPAAKCMPWANDGTPVWNATRCIDIFPGPDAVGESCTVEGSGVSGIDSCDFGSICFGTDPRTLEGTCVANCAGTADAPLCDDPDEVCVQANGAALALCLPTCHPLLSDCAEDEVCVTDGRNGRGFCAPAMLSPTPSHGPCELHNVCEPGLVCAGTGFFAECEGAFGCCAPLCDTDAPETCPATEPYCLPVVADPARALAGYETVGVCSVEPRGSLGGEGIFTIRTPTAP